MMTPIGEQSASGSTKQNWRCYDSMPRTVTYEEIKPARCPTCGCFYNWTWEIIDGLHVCPSCGERCWVNLTVRGSSEESEKNEL